MKCIKQFHNFHLTGIIEFYTRITFTHDLSVLYDDGHLQIEKQCWCMHLIKGTSIISKNQ